MAQLSNYAICYEAIQRVYRNAVITAARQALRRAYPNDWLERVQRVFQREWQEVVDAALSIRITGDLDASLVDDFDCLGVNHFYNLFDKFFDDIFPRQSETSDDQRRRLKARILERARDVNRYRNAMSHPSEHDLPYRDALLLLDTARRLLEEIDSEAARFIETHESQLNRGVGVASPVRATRRQANLPPDEGMYGIKFIRPAHLKHEMFNKVFGESDRRQPLMNFKSDFRRGASRIPVHHQSLVYVVEWKKFVWAIEYTGTLEDGDSALRQHGFTPDSLPYPEYSLHRPIRFVARIDPPESAADLQKVIEKSGVNFRPMPQRGGHRYLTSDDYQRLFNAIDWTWLAESA